MRRSTPAIAMTVLSCVVFACCAFANEAADTGQRTWTSKRGTTIDAAFVKLAFGKVHLKKADDSVVSIPLGALSADDQVLAKKLGATSAPKLSGGGSKLGGSSGGAKTLTDEEIEKFETSWEDEKKGVTIRFQARIGIKKLAGKQKEKYKKIGKIPFRITVDLGSVKPGKRVMKRITSGRAEFYLLDEEGNVAFKKRSAPLSKLCPT